MQRSIARLTRKQNGPARALLSAAIGVLTLASASAGQTITEIIDATGDGSA